MNELILFQNTFNIFKDSTNIFPSHENFSVKWTTAFSSFNFKNKYLRRYDNNNDCANNDKAINGSYALVIKTYPLWSMKKQSYSSKHPGIYDSNRQVKKIRSLINIKIKQKTQSLVIWSSYHIQSHPSERAQRHVHTKYCYEPWLLLVENLSFVNFSGFQDKKKDTKKITKFNKISV